MKGNRVILSAALAALTLTTIGFGQTTTAPAYDRTEDIVYGRKYGTALTLDMLTPKHNRNRAAVIWVVSGGWFSSHEGIRPKSYEELLRRGYTVFAVVHGSQPKFTIPEIMDDLHRAVRFIRYNAGRFDIDSDRFGITGGSAGGHLSLMIGTSGKAGSPTAGDIIDRQSSRVQAVACFFPPTDFMNYGEPGRDALIALENELAHYMAPFQFTEYDQKTRTLIPVEPKDRRLAILREISPITHVTSSSAPTLIIHGDADYLVPLQQSTAIKDRMEEANVAVKLIVRPGAGHGWKRIEDDQAIFADWFDACLLGTMTATPAAGQ